MAGISSATAKTKMAAQVRDSASPRRLIDGQGKMRVRGAGSQILFAFRLLRLLGLV
jgi:hypothetical protein